MQDLIKIQEYNIGLESPVFIIAEAGVNHNGDIKIAKQLIRKAKECGADCIKFQTFKAERVVTEKAPKAKYQLGTTDPAESQLDMLRKLEMSSDSYNELISFSQDQGILFFSTPYNIEDVDFLDSLGVPAFKLASIHLAEPYFLQYVASKGKPLFVSTGMATLAEVDQAIHAIREVGNQHIILLQCTTNYPSRVEDANLRAIGTMRDAFDILVGYSDHTQSNTTCLAAVALGACVLEKHFTLDKNLPGPDQSSSADPAELEHLINQVREVESSLGSGLKEPAAVEKENAPGMRRSIVAKQDIKIGEIISSDMLTFKRPATGLSPALFDEVIGRLAITDIKAGQMILWEMCGAKQRNDHI